MPTLPPIATFEDLPLELKLALSIAAADLCRASDVHGRNAYHYVMTMDRSIRRNPDNPWKAVEVQLTYILENSRTWRGDKARAARLVFRRFLKRIDERSRPPKPVDQPPRTAR